MYDVMSYSALGDVGIGANSTRGAASPDPARVSSPIYQQLLSGRAPPSRAAATTPRHRPTVFAPPPLSGYVSCARRARGVLVGPLHVAQGCL